MEREGEREGGGYIYIYIYIIYIYVYICIYIYISRERERDRERERERETEREREREMLTAFLNQKCRGQDVGCVRAVERFRGSGLCVRLCTVFGYSFFMCTGSLNRED